MNIRMRAQLDKLQDERDAFRTSLEEARMELALLKNTAGDTWKAAAKMAENVALSAADAKKLYRNTEAGPVWNAVARAMELLAAEFRKAGGK